MRKFIKTALLVMTGLLLGACDQSTVHFADESSGNGACGPWYPGGGDLDSGPGFDIEEGAVFPCLVWESVRQHKEDTWLNIGDVYLSAKHGDISAKALVIVKVGLSCAGCHDLVVALSKRQADLEPVAAMLALTHGDAFYPDIAPLAEVESVIVDDEGWPAQWYLTNDAENHFSDSRLVGIPWVTVVSLKDMRVISSSNSRFAASNVDELIALIKGL